MNEYIPLPNGYKWYTYDMTNINICNKVSAFLRKHYIPDKKHNYRIQYSGKFLRWLFTVPGRLNICIGVESKNGIMAGFVSGTIIKMQINKNTTDIVENKFMCVHLQLRKKGLGRQLLKQITKQFEQYGQVLQKQQGTKKKLFCVRTIYGSVLEKDTALFTGKYYHRPLNIDNLIDSDLLKTTNNVKIDDVKKKYYLPDNPTNTSFRKIKKDDIEETFNLFKSYITKYNCHPILNLKEFTHIFYNDHVSVYVLIIDDVVVDFISYFKLPIEIKNKHAGTKILNRAYLYYYTSDEETPYRLIRDLLIVARNNGIDVLIASDIMEHGDIMQDLNFMDGPNKINYYLRGIKSPKLSGKQIGLFSQT